MDTIMMCYMSTASGAPNSWNRVKKVDGDVFFIKVLEYNYAINSKCPEL